MVSKAKSKFIPVILAGGKGERFWPLSRQNFPKQFLCLDGTGNSLLQQTAHRLLSLADGWENLWLITSEELAAGIQEQLPNLKTENMLCEPMAKDTAPAIAWATLEIAKRYGPDAVIGFFPSDHWIARQSVFETTIEMAADYAQNPGGIITLGIQAIEPSPHYGYIELGSVEIDDKEIPLYRVARFTEKPDRKTAEIFLATGRYCWNSGMFIFQAETALQELRQYAPELMDLLEEQGVEAYPQLEKKSIDYVLMEKTQQAYLIAATFGWDDLGDWTAFERIHSPDNNKTNNINIGHHVYYRSNDCIVYTSDKDEVVVTIGLEDMVIVRDGNVTLVTPKKHTSDIKKILQKLRDSGDQYQDIL
ncbi:MAG: mannose-1-phosphate guanylyltransferase [Microcystaceae cyanobacterium]